MKDMIGNLTEIRGGCVIFIDYSYYENNLRYFQFLTHFDRISSVVTRKLMDLESEGFQPDNWFMFGHSAGARLVIDAAANFGYQKVKEIDGELLQKHSMFLTLTTRIFFKLVNLLVLVLTSDRKQ